MTHLQNRITEVGLEPERLAMFNLSAAMGPKWAEICQEFTETIHQLGPSPFAQTIREGDEP